jgi:hypothetical protein
MAGKGHFVLEKVLIDDNVKYCLPKPALVVRCQRFLRGNGGELVGLWGAAVGETQACRAG